MKDKEDDEEERKKLKEIKLKKSNNKSKLNIIIRKIVVKVELNDINENNNKQE